jgi:hypothetical protein
MFIGNKEPVFIGFWWEFKHMFSTALLMEKEGSAKLSSWKLRMEESPSRRIWLSMWRGSIRSCSGQKKDAQLGWGMQFDRRRASKT